MIIPFNEREAPAVSSSIINSSLGKLTNLHLAGETTGKTRSECEKSFDRPDWLPTVTDITGRRGGEKWPPVDSKPINLGRVCPLVWYFQQTGDFWWHWAGKNLLKCSWSCERDRGLGSVMVGHLLPPARRAERAERSDSWTMSARQDCTTQLPLTETSLRRWSHKH